MADNKKVFDIDELGAEPLAEVATSRGLVYLYGPGEIAVGRWSELAKLDSETRGAQLLPELTSLVRRERFSDGMPPLPPEVSDALTENDVLRLADALRKVLAARKAEALHVDDRRPDESARAFFARIAQAEFEAEAARLRATWKKAMDNLGGSVKQMFRGLEVSRAQLGGTLNSLDQLNRRPAEYIRGENQMAEIQARAAQERREDRDRALLSSQATVESAQVLQQLAATAESVMIRVAAQDVKLDRQTRIQLWVAVVTAALGLLVAIVSVVYAGLSYQHDLAKDVAEDASAKAATAREERSVRALEQNAVLLQENERLLQELRAIRSAGAAQAPASAAPLLRRNQ